MSADQVAPLCDLALPKPASAGSRGGALAIALHCLMVREGFSVEDDQQQTANPKAVRRSSYQPPSTWQSASGLPNEWQFVYSHAAKVNRFKLIVSLHEESGRTFVHCSEDLNPNNVQILGLQLENYVPEGPAGTSPLKAHDWSSVLVNTESLESYFLNHIVRPILDAAADVLLAPASPRRLTSSKSSKRSRSPSRRSRPHGRSEAAKDSQLPGSPAHGSCETSFFTLSSLSQYSSTTVLTAVLSSAVLVAGVTLALSARRRAA